jgi:hypothetical protein
MAPVFLPHGQPFTLPHWDSRAFCSYQVNFKTGLLKMNRTGKGGFRSGQSGNPGGKPRELRDIQVLARKHGATAISALASISLNGKSEAARVAASVALLDRGFGRGRAVTLTLPSMTKASDLPAALGIVAQAVATGSLSPEDGTALAGILDAHRKSFETCELEARLDQIEREASKERDE